jgi:hypothetical protein
MHFARLLIVYEILLIIFIYSTGTGTGTVFEKIQGGGVGAELKKLLN